MKTWTQHWLPVLLWCGLIFFLSAQPRLPSPDDAALNFVIKKLGHLTVYAVLFGLVYRAFRVKTKNRTLKAFVFCVVYAISDEIHQSFVPGRTPMMTDVGIDIVGMILGDRILSFALSRPPFGNLRMVP